VNNILLSTPPIILEKNKKNVRTFFQSRSLTFFQEGRISTAQLPIQLLKGLINLNVKHGQCRACCQAKCNLNILAITLLLYNSSVASEEKSFQISANAGKKSLPLHVNSSATRKDKSSNFWIPELHKKQYL
jgi:hypothetical protein